jgi:hypothetical protein
MPDDQMTSGYDHTSCFNRSPWTIEPVPALARSNDVEFEFMIRLASLFRRGADVINPNASLPIETLGFLKECCRRVEPKHVAAPLR